MKYISFVVPCYNSEDYMEKCIDSLLIGKNDIEIIIIDDGSTDNTGSIADRYQKKYPKIVKVIHQENSGHGEGINKGLKVATGKYFKVIDSDDWVDEKAYRVMLRKIKKIDSDLVVTNYVYTYGDGRKDYVMDFNNVYKHDKEITWDEMGRWKMSQYPSLHSMMYKKDILDKCDINLPKNVCYDDNLFIYIPLKYTETIYYLDIDFYRYFIGRPEQSISSKNLIGKSDDQVIITKEILRTYDLDEIDNKKLRGLMKKECTFMMTVGVLFTRLHKTKIAEQKYKELWEYVKEINPKLYKDMRKFSMAYWASLPTPIGRFIVTICYKIAYSMVNFY